MSDESAGAQPWQAEFEAALLAHLEAMVRLARFLLRENRADADDLVQEAAFRAFEAFPRFRRGSNLRAWLFRILRNAYVDLLRRRGRLAELAGPEEGALENHPAVEEFRAQAAREHTEADLETALAGLEADLRMVLLLIDGEGMRYDEVAAILECPVGTVRSRLHRARRLLRQRLLEIWRGRAHG